MKLKTHLYLISISVFATLAMQLISNNLGLSALLIPTFPLSLAFLIRYGKQAVPSVLVAGLITGIAIAWSSVLYKYSLAEFIIFSLVTGMVAVLQGLVGQKIYNYFLKKYAGNEFSNSKAIIYTSLLVASSMGLISFLMLTIVSQTPLQSALALSARFSIHFIVNYIMVLPFALYLLGVYSFSNKYKGGYLHYMFLALIVLSVFSINVIESNNKNSFISELNTTSEEITLRLQNEFETLHHDIKSIEALYGSSKYIDENEFYKFNTFILEDKDYLKSIYFVTRLSRANHKTLQKEFKKEGKELNSLKANEDFRFAVKYQKKNQHKVERSLDFLESQFIDSYSSASPQIVSINKNEEELIYMLKPVFKDGQQLGLAVLEIDTKQLFKLASGLNMFSSYSFTIKDTQDNQLAKYAYSQAKNNKAQLIQVRVANKYRNMNLIFEGRVLAASLISKAKGSYWVISFVFLMFTVCFIAVILTLIGRDGNLTSALRQMQSEVKLRKETEKRLQVLNRDLEREIFKRTQEMRERNMELESIFKAFPDILFRLDNTGVVQSYESGEGSNFYLDARLILGKKITEILNRDVGLLFEEKIKKSLVSGDVQTVSYSQVLGGYEKSFEARFTKYSDDKVLVIVRDVTDLVTMEEKIKEQNLLAIKNAKMVSLGEMAGGIAHEINNPLTIIDGSANIISLLIEKDNFDKNKIHHSVKRISHTVQRIARIVSGLRKFARDGSHDSFEEVVLADFIEDTLGLCSERFRNFGVQLDVDIKIPDDFAFQGRGVELSQVLINLLNNAFDACKNEAEKWVKLEVYNDTDNVIIEVTDSGPGIPTDLKDKIMQPFFTTKEIGVGTGLGLSISKGIVEHHSGRLELDEKSEFTRFRMIFPIHQYIEEAAA